MKKILAALTVALLACGVVQPQSPPLSSTPSMADQAAAMATSDGLPMVYVNGAAQHVSFHNFWSNAGWPLGSGMRWELLAQGAPWDSSGYPLADGYGGEHALLFSGMSGNIIFNQGQPEEQIITFGSLDTPPEGVLSDVQVSIKNDAYGIPSIVTEQNGIPCGQTFIPRGLQRTVAGAGSGTLFAGGSDHSEFIGYIAAIRGWDTVPASDTAVTQARIPQRFFDNVGPSGEPADLLVSFISPTLETYPDLSGGYDSNGAQPRRMTHPGVPYSGLDYSDVYWNPPVPPSQLPQVKYLANTPLDPNYNENLASNLAALKRDCTPTPPPAGALIFDSFCRPDQEFFHSQHPDMGSVEFNSLGTNSRWQSGSPTGAAPSVPAAGDGQNYAVGIYNRSPVPLDYMSIDSWVDAASGDRTVTTTRRPHRFTSSDGNAGIAFRRVDESHLWVFAFQNVQAGDGTVVDRRFYLLRFDGYGYPGLILTADLPDALQDFAQLSVSAHGSDIVCSADGVPLISTTDATYATATGFGLHMSSALSRQYDFTVAN